MIIGIDFDGTVVTHNYPQVGEDVDGAVAVLKELILEGHLEAQPTYIDRASILNSYPLENIK